jgi:predicted nucleic acid-binding protein
MTAYLDASVLLPTLVNEKASEAVDTFLLATSHDLPIGDFAGAEVASAMSRLVRANLLDTTDATTRLTAFDTWRAALTSTPAMATTDARLADVFVRRFVPMLRAPDALHVAICRRLDLTHVSLDRRLADAARALGLRAQIPGS